MDNQDIPGTSGLPRSQNGLDSPGSIDRVPQEIVNMLGNAILPNIRAADALNTSLWKNPLIILNTRNVSKLLKNEEYYRNRIEACKPPEPEPPILTVTIE